MNTRTTSKLALTASITLALGLFATTPFQLQAQGKGASKLMQITTPKPAPQSTVQEPRVMPCQDCVDRAATVRDTDPKGAGARALMSGKAPTRQIARHLCVECKSEWQLTGHGKAKTSVPTHACAKCL
jgi:hypothetical protein